RPEDLAKARGAVSSSPTESAGPNRVAIRPLKRTYIKVTVDNEKGNPTVERWISPADGTVEFRGQHVSVRVLDRDAVQITKNGEALEDNADHVTVNNLSFSVRQKTASAAAGLSPENPTSMRATPPPLRPYRTKVGMISLGCAKNLVDAEIMLGSVLQCGMEITSRAQDADVLVVNTCAFIDSAKEESINSILEAHQQRGLSKRPNQKLIVSGCMSQRFSSELRELL